MATYYVSTTGSDSNNGTSLGTALRNPQTGANRLTNPGDILYIKAGTYNSNYYDSRYAFRISNKTGTQANPILVAAYPGDEGLVIIDAANLTSTAIRYCGYTDGCSYLTIRGIQCNNARDQYQGWTSCGFAIEDGYNVRLERCSVSNNGNGFGYAGTNDYIYFLNCDAYNNYDDWNHGDLANGYSTNIMSGTHHFFDGCRAWLNCDDGWDCYSKDYGSGYITYKNCWSFRNGASGGYTGNGMGFKVGMSHLSAEGGIQRTLTNCLSFDNRIGGYDESQDGYPSYTGDQATSIPTAIYNCVSFRNGVGNGGGGFNFQFGPGWDGLFGQDLIKNCVSYGESVGSLTFPEGSNDLVTNSWQLGFTLSNSDFLSVDSTGTDGPRQSDGSLPVLNFLRPSSTSRLIDRGTNVGLPYSGTAPDVGAYEYAGITIVPTVTTSSITNISSTTATSGGNVISDGGASVTARGVCWAITANPTIANSKTIDGTGTGIFTSSITGLTQATIYHVRAYATNSVGTTYGSDVQFVTTTPVVLPTVVNPTFYNIGLTSAGCTVNLTNNGGGTVTAKGVCWTVSGTHTPTTADLKTVDLSPTLGFFDNQITGLTANTVYEVRGYATNSAGTAYTLISGFTTLNFTLPTVSTTSITSITKTTASSGGNITLDGGAAVTNRGVCWSTTINPTTALLTKTSNGIGTGVFSSSITGLTANTTYYIRAYAVNSMGVAYGNEISFTTSPDIPSVAIDQLYNVTNTTVEVSGMVISENGASVATKGACWSLTANPTIADSKTILYGSGTGIFSSTMSGLTPGTLYHIRTYATNSAGTGYSADYTITTLAAQTFCEIVKAQVKKWLCIPVAGYGALYNWYAVNYNINGTSIAPTGWHVPTLNDWNVLRVYLGWTGCGDHLKETGTVRWPEPNSTATNDTGFTGRPGGYRRIDGIFADIGLNGYFWHADLNIGNTYGYMNLVSISDFLGNGWGITYANHGVNIRCVKDTTTLSNGQTSQFIDVDGNTVFTVCIGTQEWMASNLKVTRYNDGTSIPLITNDKSWGEDVDGAMCYYNNDINNV
jgi:uncharacterized protein (TIGR02145 family)